MKNNFCKNMVRLAALVCSFAILGNFIQPNSIYEPKNSYFQANAIISANQNIYMPFNDKEETMDRLDE